MKAIYNFCANAKGRRAKAIMDEFVRTFGQNATSLKRWDADEIIWRRAIEPRPVTDSTNDNVGANMIVPFDPQLSEAAEKWAADKPEITLSEFFNRCFSKSDCQSAPMCKLGFPNCYVVPEEYHWRPCPHCPADRPEATGNIANRVQQKKGIGESHGLLLVNQSMATEIAKFDLNGFDVVPWNNNRRYSLVEPRCILHEVLLEGHNVLGLEAGICAGCRRQKFQYVAGPMIVKELPYAGEDVVRVKSGFCQVSQTWMDSYIFSQRAAQFFVTNVKAAKYSEPVFFHSSSNLPVVP